MQKINGSFFNPRANLKGKVSEHPLPTSISESNTLYRTLWQRHYHFLVGTTNCTYDNNSPVDLLNVDPFFSLSMTLPLLYSKIGKEVELSIIAQERLSSNIGLLHYLNIFVPLTLLVELASIKLLEKAAEKEWDDTQLTILSTTLSVLTAPFLILSIVSQICYLLVELLLAAILVTISSVFWYPISLLQILNSDTIESTQVDDDIFSVEDTTAHSIALT